MGALIHMSGQLIQEIILENVHGKKYNLLDMQPGDLDIEELAHRAAILNRWCGSSRFPVSVATHSVFVSDLCSDSEMWGGLCHDLTEAAGLNDMISPIKKHMPDYRRLEDIVRLRMNALFGFPASESRAVKTADLLARAFERQYLKNGPTPDARPQYHMLAFELLRTEIPWKESKQLFLDQYEYLVQVRHSRS